MTVSEKIAEILLEKAITVGLLQETMKLEHVTMEQAVGVWRLRIRRYVNKHTEEEGWLKNVDELAAEWIDPDYEDTIEEAKNNAATGGYVAGYVDGFKDALEARGVAQAKTQDGEWEK